MEGQGGLKRAPRSRLLKHIGLAAASLVMTLVAAELGFRWLLFGSGSLGEPLRDPGLYADYFSDDAYWKLYYRFGGPHEPPAAPHPMLGWVGTFSRDDYVHDDAAHVGDRRSVLLYGDSYARCVDSVTCFETLLNEDPGFAIDRYLLNYAVGGYGLDQIYLLLRESVDRFRDPFVVVGLLTFDLDRSALSVRTGQKPRFRIEDGHLALEPEPITPDPADFFDSHPAFVPSYLYRRLLHSGLLPRPVGDWLRGEQRSRRLKMELNEKIIDAILDELERRDLDFLFVVFHTEFPGVSELAGRDDWRDRFLRRLLDERGVPYVWSKEIVAADMAARDLGPDAYIDPGHRHPTTRYNRLVAAEIARRSARAAP